MLVIVTKFEIAEDYSNIDMGFKHLLIILHLTGSTVEYFTGRVPPPAHSSATNHHHQQQPQQQQQQQQQNGAYFDFDRWNLPPPASKIFSASPATVHQQHHHHHPQGLMVPHPHHPPPPLPYFPPFHLAPHPPEFQTATATTVELTPVVSAYNEQASQVGFVLFIIIYNVLTSLHCL